MPEFKIRPGTKADVATILDLIRGLAEYERLAHECIATETGLASTLFGIRPQAETLIGELDGLPIGFALFFGNYSTFLGKGGIFLEDLFVRPEYRGKGYGKALLRHLAQIAVKRGAGRLEWSVLDWNEPSIAFYKSLGAVPMDEWTVFRVTGEALQRLGEGNDAVEESFPHLSTERLHFRKISAADRGQLVELMRDETISKNLLNCPFPFTEQDADMWIARANSGRPGRWDWAIVPRDSDQMIGGIGLACDPGSRLAGSGFWLGAEYRNRGYASEALNAVVRHAFENLDALRFSAEHFSHNPASGRVMEKVGMKAEGVLRSAVLKNGEPMDLHVWGMTAGDFQARRAAEQ